MNFIPSFLRNLFVKSQSNFVAPAPSIATIATPVVKKPNRKHTAAYKKPYGRWVYNQLRDYDGTRAAIVKVPDGMPMNKGQNAVASHVAQRFGPGKLSTRRYDTARTIHIRPIR